MIVFLCEERSMRDTLAILISRHHPALVEGIHWQIVFFRGKADLEKNLAWKMRSWNHGARHFVILRDKDGADCLTLKARLHALAATVGKPFHIRIVCEELESWFLGDLAAVEAAFPASRATRSTHTAKYRNPDLLTNASDELARLTGVHGKVSKAKAIAPHLEPARNTSHSFQLLQRTFAELLT